ncbi:hypothetical protein [uncultured Alsobacter sp.]|uniref:hypothetical protein n=1 Tax=uncultured Alsobacter sp. TaxID=1748258 RepID=UPI0025DD0CDC|nr:hypothetical protein [uncultured Alsobacter sp.]
MTRNLFRLFAAAACVGLGGCAAPYIDRTEGVAFGAGDAVAWNMAQHVIDPWPRAANQTSITMDGERAQRAIDRYRTNRVPLSGGSSFKSDTHDGGGSAPASGGSSGKP